MSREEEEKERNNLGELTEPIFEERGGFPPSIQAPVYLSGQHIPPDIEYQEGVEADVRKYGKLGTIPRNVHVTTTFDARPINAIDFVETQKVRIAFQNPNGVAVDIPGVASFTVPDGYVGILRDFRWSFNVPIFPKDANDNFEIGIIAAAIKVNDSAVPFYDNLIQFGTEIPNPIPCYVIAEPLQIISIEIQLGNVDTGTTNTTLYDEDITIFMHGNLLLRERGLPAQFEPGSS